MGVFVGFGFGPIQAGLFLAEAHLSGDFGRLVVAEVLPDVVEAVRQAGGYYVNIGHADRIESLHVRPLEIFNPLMTEDRVRLVEAVAAATELATALPSVAAYTAGDKASVAGILADGLRRKAQGGGPLAIVYAAENHTRAAEILQAAVMAAVPVDERARVLQYVQFLDTVIGKMSGVPAEMSDLATVAPGLERAFLVEAFNRILIGRIRRPGDSADGPLLAPGWTEYRRGIKVFVEKSDLRPFAEAKLYGHNAGHALAGYLARLLALERIDELRSRPDLIAFVRSAMVRESGLPLCRRYAGFDPLFTAEGFRDYADDLIARMVNPYVRDTVERVVRDPARKLGWEDRLVGAMRMALTIDVEPRQYAWGAAAALDMLCVPSGATVSYLDELWSPAAPDGQMADAVQRRIVHARLAVARWMESGFPELET